MESKTRYVGERVRPIQKEYLINFMAEHPSFSRQKLMGKEGKMKYKDMWMKLAEELNKLGPVKEVYKWQRVWVDLKNAAKKKGAEIARHRRGTGGGPPCPLGLSPLDEIMLDIISKDAVEGVDNVDEDGELTGRSSSYGADLLAQQPQSQSYQAQAPSQPFPPPLHQFNEPSLNLENAEFIIDINESTPSQSEMGSDIEGSESQEPRRKKKKSELAKANEIMKDLVQVVKQNQEELSLIRGELREIKEVFQGIFEYLKMKL